MLIVGLEVAMRYIFASPTLWAWDVNKQIFAAILLLSVGYVFLQKGHIAVDVLVGRLSPRRRALVDLITAPVFFIGIAILLWQGGIAAWDSLLARETTSGIIRFPLYTIKVMLPVGVFLLLLQGAAKFIGNLVTFTSKEGV